MGKVLDFDRQLEPKVNKPVLDDDAKSLKKMTQKLEDQAAKAEAEQLALDKIVSRFERSLNKHKKRLKKKKQTLTDSAGNIAILTAMLSMTLNILPIAEKQYKRYKNDRAATSVIMLVKQAREISTDIQRLGGAASASPVIINTIISPNFQHLLQSTLNEGATAVKKFKLDIPKEYHKKLQEIINVYIKNQSNYMSQINLAISEQIEKYFDEK